MALQRAVRPGATVRRYAAPYAEPWLDAVTGEPHGTLARRVAPLPEVPLAGPLPEVRLGGPWPVVVPQVGLPAQPRHLGRGLFLVGRTNRCST